MGLPRVLIIGAGFGGVAAAVALLEDHACEVTLLERAAEVGGVWRENTYPGAGCDVPSALYSYSFAPNPDWPRRFSLQPDILAYLQDTADRFGVTERVEFGVDVTGAVFDEAGGCWQVTSADGRTWTAEVIVAAVGQLSTPNQPRIEGVELFEGSSFHSARWDHMVPLEGRRVAVIGTGASSVQFVPQLQALVGHLDVFQRTPPWVVPRPDRQYTAIHRALFRRVPFTQLLERLGVWLLGELLTLGLTRSRLIGKVIQRIALRQLRRQVPDPELRAKLTPNYPAGCKRVLFSDTYLPALSCSNVDVITDSIASITSTGVRTADGVDHPVDVIVYGTGFAVSDYLVPVDIRGRDGVGLRTAWADGARAYLGLTVPGFPNLFLMYGPNTNLGANSIVYMLEAQARYVRQAVAGLDGACLEVRPDVEARYDREIQRRLGHSVWAMCSSWYRNADGRIVTNWPGLVSEYRRRTRRLDLADFSLTRGHSEQMHPGEFDPTNSQAIR